MIISPRDNPNAGKQIVHEDRPYSFGSYDPAWPDLFSQYAATLRETLGNEIDQLEHVGSTSVPGMAGKPQIDILVTVKDFPNIPAYYDKMQQKGFTPRGDYTNEGEEYFTKDGEDGSRQASVHVLPIGHRWAGELLAFRDYLRTHPEEMEYYRNAKQEAHRLYPNDYTNYYIRKDPVLKEVKARAIMWRHEAQ
jgi:GrpB-like predicted nucleotidyltransferase (UPF0157 family)